MHLHLPLRDICMPPGDRLMFHSPKVIDLLRSRTGELQVPFQPGWVQGLLVSVIYLRCLCFVSLISLFSFPCLSPGVLFSLDLPVNSLPSTPRAGIPAQIMSLLDARNCLQIGWAITLFLSPPPSDPWLTQAHPKHSYLSLFPIRYRAQLPSQESEGFPILSLLKIWCHPSTGDSLPHIV